MAFQMPDSYEVLIVISGLNPSSPGTALPVGSNDEGYEA